jgi:hypothetical protein
MVVEPMRMKGMAAMMDFMMSERIEKGESGESRLRFLLGLRYEMLLVYLYHAHVCMTFPVPVRLHESFRRCVMLTSSNVKALGKINQVQAETTRST